MSTIVRPAGGAATGPEGRLGGLTGRMMLASGLLMLLIAGAIGLLVVAIEDLRDSGRVARDAREELIALDAVEKLVVDLETGLRGFVITGEPQFLDPWNDARAALPARLRTLERLVAESPAQLRRTRLIARDIRSYIHGHGVPLVAEARGGAPSARTVAATEEGKRRGDSLRAVFGRFRATERSLINERQERADVAARRAVRAAVVALVLSIVLVLLFSGYLTRAIVRPVRRLAQMAGRLAGGDLSMRMPATGVGEVGRLEQAFNEMAGSLERSRDDLADLAAEQAALRRVATLVARRATPPEVFTAVANEAGRLFAADRTFVARYDGDDTVTLVAAWSATGEDLRLGQRFPLTAGGVGGLVRNTARPARSDRYGFDVAPADPQAGPGVRAAVGAPITVEGRLWGLTTVASTGEEPPAPGTEARLAEFTELVATAIANAEARGELAASRARVVAAADETRRRIERDLHDGAQQRLVSLALRIRAAAADAPPELTELHGELARVGAGLDEALAELRETARGIHPVILSEGGLGPALRTLARRSSVPVDLVVGTRARLPERVEVTAYYVISEALANVAKHANASEARVEVSAEDGVLQLGIRDDGVGGADPGRGSGLIGLKDRVEASGGTITLESRRGAGTTVSVELPIDGAVPTDSS